MNIDSMLFHLRRNNIVKFTSLLSLILCSSFFYYFSSSLPSSFDISFSDDTSILSLFNTSDYLFIPGRLRSISAISSIFIINLPRRIDRRIDSIGLIQTLNLQASLVPAYSTSSMEIRQLSDRHGSLTPTEFACWASHLRLWKTLHHLHQFNQSSMEWTMILEDDVDVEFDLVDRLNTFPPSIWNQSDMIYIGHCANPPGRLIYRSMEYHFRIHSALHPTCTHAYLIHARSLPKMIYYLSQPRKPIDETIVELVNNNDIVAYSVHPPLAQQKIVSDQNPSDVNLIDRRSIQYRVGQFFYGLIQWWNGVEKDLPLNQSTLMRMNRQKANLWRLEHEHSIWVNHSG